MDVQISAFTDYLVTEKKHQALSSTDIMDKSKVLFIVFAMNTSFA